MNKRIRKKWHVGEFKEFGIQLSFQLNMKLTLEEANELIYRLIDHVEAHNLEFGGGVSRQGIGGYYVMREGQKSVLESDRAILETFMKSESMIETYKIGELSDANT